MNLLNRMMSYDKTKNVNQKCDCEEGINIKVENQTVEYSPLSDEEIEQIIKEQYDFKDEKTKTFIRKALRKHGDRYDYSNVVYIKDGLNVEIICRVEGHEPFPQAPHNHLQGKGCKLCAIKRRINKQKLTTEKFIEKATKKHGVGTYDYSKVKYVDCYTDVSIICHNHDISYEFPQAPFLHLQGHGCDLCAMKTRADKRRKTVEEFIEEANEVHGEGTYDYSKVNYVNNQTEVIVVCPKHGDFKQKPNDHLIDCGCRNCHKSNGEIEIRNFLIKNKIEFEEQKQFDKCKYINSLSFDFYLPKYNLCIEYDGKQHFEKVNWTGKMTEEQMEENLKSNQIRDQIKNDYCKNNKINLLRIRYDENIEEKLEYFSKL